MNVLYTTFYICISSPQNLTDIQVLKQEMETKKKTKIMGHAFTFQYYFRSAHSYYAFQGGLLLLFSNLSAY